MNRLLTFKLRSVMLVICCMLLQRCSNHPTVQIERNSDFNLISYGSIVVKPLKIYPTFRSSALIAAKRQEISLHLSSALTEKGYRITDSSQAQLRAELALSSTPASSSKQEDLRFSQGVRGSRFPSADPRTGSYHTDSLILQLVSTRNNTLLFRGTCLLNASEEHLANSVEKGLSGETSFNKVLRCISRFVETIPSRL